MKNKLQRGKTAAVITIAAAVLGTAVGTANPASAQPSRVFSFVDDLGKLVAREWPLIRRAPVPVYLPPRGSSDLNVVATRTTEQALGPAIRSSGSNPTALRRITTGACRLNTAVGLAQRLAVLGDYTEAEQEAILAQSREFLGYDPAFVAILCGFKPLIR